MAIPRVIHLIYFPFKGPMSQEWADNLAKWREVHAGWEVKLWGPQEVEALMEEEPYVRYKPMYDNVSHPIMRVDLARYAILHKEGGVYTDMDGVPNRSIEPILALYEAVPNVQVALPARYRDDTSVNSHFLLSHPGASFWFAVLDEAQRRANKWYPTQHLEIMCKTGPRLLGDVQADHGRTAQIIPWAILSSCDNCGHCLANGLNYITDQSAATWHQGDSALFTSIKCSFQSLPFSALATLGIVVGVLLTIIVFLSLIVFKQKRVQSEQV